MTTIFFVLAIIWMANEFYSGWRTRQTLKRIDTLTERLNEKYGEPSTEETHDR